VEPVFTLGGGYRLCVCCASLYQSSNIPLFISLRYLLTFNSSFAVLITGNSLSTFNGRCLLLLHLLLTFLELSLYLPSSLVSPFALEPCLYVILFATPRFLLELPGNSLSGDVQQTSGGVRDQGDRSGVELFNDGFFFSPRTNICIIDYSTFFVTYNI